MSNDGISREGEGSPEGGKLDENDEIAVEVDDSAIDDAANAQGPEADSGEATAAEPTDAERIAALQAHIQELEQQQKETYDRFLRATADLDNFRKRSRREVQDARTDARASALREILPVVDNLERALQHAEASREPGGVLEGVKLVLRQFAQALERCEVVPIEAEGLAFDPNVHEAISQLETEEHAPGTIMHVMQRGYRIGQRLLRPSMVVVAKAPPVAEEPDGNAGSGNGADKGNGASADMAAGGSGELAVADDSAEEKGEADGGEREGD